MAAGQAQPQRARRGGELALGLSWGIYSVRGKGAGDPTRVTAGNFIRTVPVIVAIGGVVLLAEPVTLRLVLASAAVLGGIGLVILRKAD